MRDNVRVRLLEMLASVDLCLRGALGRYASPNVEAELGDMLLLGRVQAVRGADRLETFAQAEYDWLLRELKRKGFPHLVRAWNFIPFIHELTQLGMDGYQAFSKGRAGAFRHWFGAVDDRVPAASALGVGGDRGSVYLLASKQPVEYWENTRQIPAYRYPRQYGPRSPSFARATLQRTENAEILYISGTASIVGHKSRHEGDIRRQIAETFANLEVLTERFAPGSAFRSLKYVRVYVRRTQDLELVTELVSQQVAPSVKVHYVRADICRPELLVEIEAIAVKQ